MQNIVGFTAGPADVVSSEADHRIGNNLAIIGSLIRLQANRAPSSDVRELLTEVSCQIDTVGRLHRLLAYTKGRVPAVLYLREVCLAMKDIAGGDDRLRISFDCSHAVTLAPESALPLGLLTAELISNAIKYAHPTGIPTHVRIGCEQCQQTMVFSFEDDGIGFPENFDPAHSDGFGMRILRSLVQQLNGTSLWENSGVGLRFECRFPIAES